MFTSDNSISSTSCTPNSNKMGRDRKLKAALDRYKGVDYKLQKQKKMQKEAEKRKRKRQQIPEENYMMSGALVPSEEKQDPVSKQVNGDIPRENGAAVAEEARNIWDTEEEDEDEEDRPQELDISKLDDSDSSDSDEDEDREDAEDEPPLNGTKEASIAEEEDGEEDIPLSDIASVTSEEKGDIVPHQRLTINNHTALLAAHKRIVLSLSKLPFSAHQSVTASEPTTIPDIDDDLNRELAFYKQALTAVQTARDILKKEGMPFSRPADYFAEMVKSDEHMGRVKQKLVDAAASKKAAQDARRQRDLKKFGKQVQVEKRQEREREKREMLERVQRLKRSKFSMVICFWS